MSKLALLVGAIPRRCLAGPTVRLLPGVHLIHIEGQVDSTLCILVEGDTNELLHGMRLRLEEPADVRVDFSKRGSESFINVMAEKVA